MGKIKNLLSWFFARKSRLLISVVLILLVGFIVVRNRKSDTTNEYQTATAQKGTIVSTVSASGKVLTTNTLSISTEASGVVKKVYVKDGDKVVAGQKLAEITLDSAGLEKNAQAYASLVSAQNSVNSANNSYRSAQASAEKVLDEVKGHDTDETLAQKETRTKAEVARDNAYDQTKSAQANLASSSLNYRSTSPIITAPFSGIIESVNLVEGMVLESSTSTTNINSQRVAVIKGDSLPVINVTVSELDVPKVKVGQKVTVTLDSVSGKTFTGVVATIDRVGSVSSNVTSYSANIKLDSSDLAILPNMAATANIILETKTDVIKIPSGAITTTNGENFANVLKNGAESQLPVTVGISSDSETEIVSGLSEGDVVVSGSAAKSSTSGTSTQTRSVFSTFGGGGGNLRIAR
ncbi:MAG: hypothetical protein US62_C0022G0014 [Candidatus Woesebacteria bacterium GW2011_GWA1_37_8]|uniref:Efflux transporter, RND family, MFP subunit n=2 Tax=Candidatus Woeseibacteriota TaxID=1752722 RepID=A0A0G0LH88_9BACT|nr:MAG: hypothetical protein US39_C0001G0138 [Microgenomates group bacterium GW2011_GWC1_37_12b]KKQ44751.1 MAG: hypothetical protein US62_C0022G0014 [Candidatus Woesebacteria bacterium GW2011_GWA1_37_8]KKQ87290.1 MAG: hypothetical protein UT10_C0008G0051 [Candidatus Woesebacteria bacterium GW2011_GWB1_38_8b]